jgi:hypothetical protein
LHLYHSLLYIIARSNAAQGRNLSTASEGFAQSKLQTLITYPVKIASTQKQPKASLISSLGKQKNSAPKIRKASTGSVAVTADAVPFLSKLPTGSYYYNTGFGPFYA